jgi:hypothetical protein
MVIIVLAIWRKLGLTYTNAHSCSNCWYLACRFKRMIRKGRVDCLYGTFRLKREPRRLGSYSMYFRCRRRFVISRHPLVIIVLDRKK